MSFAEQLALAGLDFAAVLEAAGVGVLVLDPSGVVLAANAEAAAALGWTAAHLIGYDVHDTVHIHPTSTDPGSTCPMVATAATGRRSGDDNDLFRCADGRLLPVAWTAVPLHDRSGTASHPGAAAIIVSFTDVTDQQTQLVADAASREQDRADLRAVRQSVSDLGWIAELTRVMSSTLDERDALLRLARLLTPRLADVVIVNHVDDDGRWDRLGGAAAPGVDLDLPRILADPAVSPGAEGDPTTRATLNRGSVMLLSAQQLRDPTVLDAPSRNLMSLLGATSAMVIPFAARGRLNGFAGLLRRDGPGYQPADVLLGADIGRRAGLVLDNARLYRRQQRLAADLQLALLPAVHDVPPVRAAARYLPAQDKLRVGGDWYDLFTCPSADASVVVIGDVAGHDLHAATTMAALRNVTRGIAVTSDHGPAATLSDVDASLAPLDVDGTATSLIVNAARRDDGWRLTWANAGHPPGLLIEPSGPGGPRVREIGTAPDPLLGTRSRATRTDHHAETPFGSTLLLFTDGLVEKRDEDIDNGFVRLRQAVLASPLDGHPEQLIDSLLDRLPRSVDDDTALIAVRLD